MRIVMAAALLLGLAACSGPPPAPTAPAVSRSTETASAELTLRIERNPLPLTDPLIVELELLVDESRQARFPKEIEPAGDWLANDSEGAPPRLLDDGRIALVQRYELEPLGPGELEIPPVEVEHWSADETGDIETIASEAVTVMVESALPEETETAELQDIRGPVEAPIPWWWWLVGAALAAAVGFGAYRWWKSRNDSTAEETQAALPPPHVAALAAIDQLVADRLTERGEHKLYYGLLSNILRRYVEDRYGIRAPERTTEEFLVELRSGDSLGPTHQSLLKMFLEHADLVKFAELDPAPGQAADSAELCRRLIRETAPPAPSPLVGS